jgi:hypothetical protein
LRALLQKIFLQFFHNYSLPPLPVEGPQNLSKKFLQFFYNFSTILPCVEEFGAPGLAWRRIVEGIIVETLWKHLVNAAPDIPPSDRHNASWHGRECRGLVCVAGGQLGVAGGHYCKKWTLLAAAMTTGEGAEEAVCLLHDTPTGWSACVRARARLLSNAKKIRIKVSASAWIFRAPRLINDEWSKDILQGEGRLCGKKYEISMKYLYLARSMILVTLFLGGVPKLSDIPSQLMAEPSPLSPLPPLLPHSTWIKWPLAKREEEKLLFFMAGAGKQEPTGLLESLIWCGWPPII